MKPGFFLSLAENTGDGFAYVLLPVETLEELPTRRNPTTLTRCVVRARDTSSCDIPQCQKDGEDIVITNSSGKVLIGDELEPESVELPEVIVEPDQPDGDKEPPSPYGPLPAAATPSASRKRKQSTLATPVFQEDGGDSSADC